jgi:FlaG/FlaF family flagellin (archaellin)
MKWHDKEEKFVKENDSAVSPVVGVMLMLVVTIIIAAVVSGFAGGLFASQSPAPTVSAATEYSLSNGFSMEVLSVSEPIDTANLELQLDALANGTRVSATITGSEPSGVTGSGAGITYVNRTPPEFGNFTLTSGIKMSSPGGVGLFRSSEGTATVIGNTTDAFPAGSVADEIAPDQTPPDVTTWGGQSSSQLSDYWKMNTLNAAHSKYYWMMKFNDGWVWTKNSRTITYYQLSNGDLTSGDKVSVKLIYIPNGQTIYSSDVVVVS